MKILVFDTETTGLPINNPSIYQLNNWPHIIQLSYIIYDLSSNLYNIENDYVNIDSSNVVISNESYNIHKISMDYLQTNGKNINYVLKKFNNHLKIADIIVGHNIQFDKKLIFVECFRNNIQQNFTKFHGKKKICKPEFCTMKKTTQYCNLMRIDKSNNSVIKFPKLTELYFKLFPNAILSENMHDAIIDVLITFRCYVKFNNNIDIIDTNDKINALFRSYNLI